MGGTCERRPSFYSYGIVCSIASRRLGHPVKAGFEGDVLFERISNSILSNFDPRIAFRRLGGLTVSFTSKMAIPSTRGCHSLIRCTRNGRVPICRGTSTTSSSTFIAFFSRV